MRYMVLQDFHYAGDGKNPALLHAGKPAEIRREHVERFQAEGKIDKKPFEEKKREVPPPAVPLAAGAEPKKAEKSPAPKAQGKA